MSAKLDNVSVSITVGSNYLTTRPETFRPYGLEPPPSARNDKSVQFGKALRISVDRAYAETWKIGMTVPVLKPIKVGNKVVVAFWARAHETQAGAAGRSRAFNWKFPDRPIARSFGMR